MGGEIRIRAATCADAPGIARVHVASWRATYRGLMPDAVLDGLSEERRRALWEEQLCTEPADRWRIFVAEAADGGVVGFAAGGPPLVGQEVAGYDAELPTIYLLREAQGAGTGRRLMRATAGALLVDGYHRMLLWVLSENRASRAFYERLGGVVIAAKPFEIGGATLEETAYGYDLEELVRLLRNDSGG